MCLMLQKTTLNSVSISQSFKIEHTVRSTSLSFAAVWMDCAQTNDTFHMQPPPELGFIAGTSLPNLFFFFFRLPACCTPLLDHDKWGGILLLITPFIKLPQTHIHTNVHVWSHIINTQHLYFWVRNKTRQKKIDR